MLLTAFGYASYEPRPGGEEGEVFSRILHSSGAPVIVIGDSITAWSHLPAFVEGVRIVNAGIGGASTMTDFPQIIGGALKGRRASLVIVALGTKDAFYFPDGFEQRYARLIVGLEPHANRPLLATVAPREDGCDTGAVNAVILAQDLPVIRLDLPTMPTRDGVHLTSAGYEIWRREIIAGIRARGG